MKKNLTISMAAGALALVLAACGSSSTSNTSTTGSSSSGSNVLVDSSGLALYAPDNESASKVRCTGVCTSVWMPVRPGASLKGAGKVAVITRPDGSKQVAVAGKPVYTFVRDSPGAVTGNGASDAFGGQHFTWHVVTKGGSAPAAAAGGGYGSNSGY